MSVRIVVFVLTASVLLGGGSSHPTASSVFTESWERFSAGQRWRDDTNHGAWRAIYDGYGANTIINDRTRVLRQRPKASTQPDETHAGLVVTRSSYGALDATFQVKTYRQLRTPVPNPWETAWILWNYTDDLHFYYIALKPNGWELGKEDPAYPGAQRYLATGSTPTYRVGRWHSIRVRQTGATIRVWANGVHIVTFTDTERPYTRGKVGLYNEDADVRFNTVRITRL